MIPGSTPVLALSADAWNAVGTGATALIAIGAAIAAFIQVYQARRLREAQAQPFVIVSLEPAETDPHWLILRIENVGQTLARDVRFKFDPPLASLAAADEPTYDLGQSGLVRDGLPSMPPGMKIERVLDHLLLWGDKFEKQPVKAYDVLVTFKDYRGKSVEPLSYRIDLEPLGQGAYLELKSIHHVAQSLDSIQKTVAKWSEAGVAGGGLKVWSRDGTAKDKFYRDQREAVRAQQSEPEGQGDSPLRRIYGRLTWRH